MKDELRVKKRTRYNNIAEIKPPHVLPGDHGAPEPIGLFDTLGPGCRYIHGDPKVKGWQTCGATIEHPQYDYCPYHLAKMFTKPPPRNSRSRGPLTLGERKFR